MSVKTNDSLEITFTFSIFITGIIIASSLGYFDERRRNLGFLISPEILNIFYFATIFPFGKFYENNL